MSHYDLGGNSIGGAYWHAGGGYLSVDGSPVISPNWCSCGWHGVGNCPRCNPPKTDRELAEENSQLLREIRDMLAKPK